MQLKGCFSIRYYQDNTVKAGAVLFWEPCSGGGVQICYQEPVPPSAQNMNKTYKNGSAKGKTAGWEDEAGKKYISI